jgi:hypothetical protein
LTCEFDGGGQLWSWPCELVAGQLDAAVNRSRASRRPDCEAGGGGGALLAVLAGGGGQGRMGPIEQARQPHPVRLV